MTASQRGQQTWGKAYKVMASPNGKKWEVYKAQIILKVWVDGDTAIAFLQFIYTTQVEKGTVDTIWRVDFIVKCGRIMNLLRRPII